MIKTQIILITTIYEPQAAQAALVKAYSSCHISFMDLVRKIFLRPE